MAYTIPTTEEIAAQILAAIEARINQTTPPTPKAFNRVLSVALGIFGTGFYKYASDRILQVLALTATGAGLDLIGSEYGVTRTAAIAAVLEFEITGVNGTLVPLGTDWTSNSTGETYTTLANVTIAAGVGTCNGIAATAGTTGNLANGEELTVQTAIAGLDTIGTITDTITSGTDREEDSPYRRRVLTRIRAAGGGGNAADYRQWGEAVAGVRRAFPYSGKPRIATLGEIAIVFATPANTVVWAGKVWAEYGLLVGDLITFSACVQAANNATFTVLTISGDTITVSGPVANETIATAQGVIESTPGDRSVYIESTDTGVDGVPTPTLLAAVRADLLTDPDTGLSRDTLGLTDDRLYVEPIDRLSVKVRINDLSIAAELEVTVKARITTAVADHLYNRIVCFVEGLDYPGDRNDNVTEVTLSGVIFGVLRAAGGTAGDVQIQFVRDAATAYQLDRGELAVLEAVYYDGWV